MNFLFNLMYPKTKKESGNIRGLSGVCKTVISPDDELDEVFDKIFKTLVKEIHQKFQEIQNTSLGK